MMLMYRVLSYVLLTFALFWAAGVMILLGFAFSNPALLLTLFVVTAVVLYSFSSFHFLRKGIDRGMNQKRNRKDFIKVNAYVTVFFALMNFLQSLIAIAAPEPLQDMMKQVQTLQPGAGGMDAAQLFSLLQVILWVMLFYAIALGIHVYLTFQLLHKHAALFEGAQEGNPS